MLIEKLQPYAHLFAELPDSAIADMSGATTKEVEEARLTLTKGDLPTEKQKKAAKAKVDVEVGADAQRDYISTGPKGEPAEPPAGTAPPVPIYEKPAAAPAKAAPATIRALSSFTTVRPDGRPWEIGWKDIYRGEDAQYLWARVPANFEEFPPPKG